MNPTLYQPVLATDLVALALNRDLEQVVMVLSDGTTQSARDLRDAISRFSQAFGALSPKPLRAAVLAKNRVEVPAVMNGLSFADIVATSLHPMGSIEDYLYVIEDAEIDLLVYDADYFETVAAALQQRAPRLTHFVAIGAAGVGQSLGQLAAAYVARPLAAPSATPEIADTYRLFGRHYRQTQRHHDDASFDGDIDDDPVDRVGMAGRNPSSHLRAAEPCGRGRVDHYPVERRRHDRRAGF